MDKIEHQPCPGNGVCCNRPEFDRTIFPCTLEERIKRLENREIERERDRTEPESVPLPPSMRPMKLTTEDVATIDRLFADKTTPGAIGKEMETADPSILPRDRTEPSTQRGVEK